MTWYKDSFRFDATRREIMGIMSDLMLNWSKHEERAYIDEADFYVTDFSGRNYIQTLKHQPEVVPSGIIEVRATDKNVVEDVIRKARAIVSNYELARRRVEMKAKQEAGAGR